MNMLSASSQCRILGQKPELIEPAFGIDTAALTAEPVRQVVDTTLKQVKYTNAALHFL